MAHGKLTCPNCGATVYAADDRCMDCGAFLDAGELVAPPPPAPEPEKPPAPEPEKPPAPEPEKQAVTSQDEQVTWRYQLGGRELGPVSWAEIEELLADTADAEDLLVRADTDATWRPAADVIRERGNSSSALPAKAGTNRAKALAAIGALGSLLWASWTVATTEPEDLADTVADLHEPERAEAVDADEAAGAPGPCAPAVRRPIGVVIVTVLFVLLGIVLVFCTVAAPPLAFITVPLAWFLLHGAQCLYRGFNWARIAFMVLLGLLALGGIYLLLVSVESPGPPAAGIALCVVLILILNARGARKYCSR